MQSPDNDTRSYEGLFSEHGGMKRVGQGYTLLFTGKGNRLFGFISAVVYNLSGYYPWKGIPGVPRHQNRTYATRFSGKIMCYDPKTHEITSSKIST